MLHTMDSVTSRVQMHAQKLFCLIQITDTVLKLVCYLKGTDALHKLIFYIQGTDDAHK
jgi:hypothetical protein